MAKDARVGRSYTPHMEGVIKLLDEWSDTLTEVAGKLRTAVEQTDQVRLDIRDAKKIAKSYLKLAAIDEAFLINLFREIDGDLLAAILRKAGKSIRVKLAQALEDGESRDAERT